MNRDESTPAYETAGLTGVSRRNFFKFTGVAGAGAAITGVLAACGGPSSTTTVSSSAAASTAAGTTAAGSASGAASGATSSAGSAASSPAAAAATGTITATLAFTLSSGLDPMNASSAVGTAANQHIFEGLVDLDPATRAPYPALAAALPEPSEDGLTWTVTLRDGAKFSDGKPVTAEDAAWSFTRAIDPANKALMGQFLPFLDSVTATDATTVEFKLKQPFALLPQRIAVIKVVPKALTGDADAAKAFDAAPIGSGPWVLDSSDPNTGLKFSANTQYNGPKPAKAASMVWNTTTEGATRIADISGGRVMAIEAVPYLDVEALKASAEVQDVQAFNQMFLMFNNSAKPFDDKRVRQALHYALDTDAIIANALQGFGSAAKSYLDEGNANFQQAATVYNYDAEKAKALLAEAGASDLSFELVTTDAAFIKDIAPLLVDQWKQVGVTVTLNTAPSASVYAPAPDGLVAKDGFQALAASGDPSVFGPDADLLLRWFYSGTTWPQDRARMSQATRDTLTKILDDAAAEQDPATQKTLWKQALDFIADDAGLYTVLHTKTVTAWDPAKLDGFAPVATTGLYFLDASPKG